MTAELSARRPGYRWRFAVGGRILRRFVSSRSATLAAVFMVGVLGVVAAAPLFAPYDHLAQDFSDTLSPPSLEHWLGTDRLGRDLLSRLLMGTRATVLAGFEATLVAAIIGVPAGLLSYGRSRLLPGMFSFASDVLMSIPGLLLAIAFVGIRGPGVATAMFAVGVTFAPRFYRVTVAQCRPMRDLPYIESATVSGVGTMRILYRHVLPNASGPILVLSTFTFGWAIFAEASLSFLGLGVQVPEPSWGTLVRDGFDSIHGSSFPLVPPILAIAFTVLAVQQVGESLRDSILRVEARRRL